MFEVVHPAPQSPVGFSNDLLHCSTSRSLGLLADGFLKLGQALLPWPFHATLEVIAQEVETTSLAGIHYARFGRVQCQSCLLHPLAHLFEDLSGFCLALALDNEVVCVSAHWPAPFGHQMV